MVYFMVLFHENYMSYDDLEVPLVTSDSDEKQLAPPGKLMIEQRRPGFGGAMGVNSQHGAQCHPYDCKNLSAKCPCGFKTEQSTHFMPQLHMLFSIPSPVVTWGATPA